MTGQVTGYGGMWNTTNNTVNLGVLADNDDFNIVYQSVATASGEIPAATFPAGVTGPFSFRFPAVLAGDTSITVEWDDGEETG